MAAKGITEGYVRMWPRAVFEKIPPEDGAGRKTVLARSLDFLNGPGVYVLYRDDRPHYVGQAERLRSRLRSHARKPDSRYYHFWNFFSAFAVDDANMRNELEAILIATMPTAANSAKPFSICR